MFAKIGGSSKRVRGVGAAAMLIFSFSHTTLAQCFCGRQRERVHASKEAEHEACQHRDLFGWQVRNEGADQPRHAHVNGQRRFAAKPRP